MLGGSYKLALISGSGDHFFCVCGTPNISLLNHTADDMHEWWDGWKSFQAIEASSHKPQFLLVVQTPCSSSKVLIGNHMLEQERKCDPFSHSLLYFGLYKKVSNKQYLPLPPHQHYRSGLYKSGKKNRWRILSLQCCNAHSQRLESNVDNSRQRHHQLKRHHHHHHQLHWFQKLEKQKGGTKQGRKEGMKEVVE